MVIHGGTIIVKTLVDDVYMAVAAAKTCDIEVDAELIERSNPETGNWKTFLPGKKEWSVNVSGLVQAISTHLLEVGNHVSLLIENINDATDKLTGTAYVRNVKETAAKGKLSQYTCEFKGSGPLAKVTE